MTNLSYSASFHSNKRITPSKHGSKHLAYKLANFLRTPAIPEGIERRSPTSLRERPIKTGARMVRHARYAIFHMAEAALPRSVFTGLIALINGLRGPPVEAAFHMTGTAAAGVSVRSAADGKGVTGAGQHRVSRRVAPPMARFAGLGDCLDTLFSIPDGFVQLIV